MLTPAWNEWQNCYSLKRATTYKTTFTALLFQPFTVNGTVRTETNLKISALKSNLNPNPHLYEAWWNLIKSRRQDWPNAVSVPCLWCHSPKSNTVGDNGQYDLNTTCIRQPSDILPSSLYGDYSTIIRPLDAMLQSNYSIA